MQLRKLLSPAGVLLLVAASAAPAWSGSLQAADPLSGRYEGIAKSTEIGEIPITVEIKNTGGKLSGKIDIPQGSAMITGGSYADGKLTMKFEANGSEGTVTALLKEGKIIGEWALEGQTGTLELKKATAPASAKAEAPKAPPSPAAADPLSGDWDAMVDAGGQTFPFRLKLKLDGDKVTGTSESDQGSATISKGSLTGGKLTISLDTPNGTVVLTGTVIEGKIEGDFDFAGQFQGKWSAKKR